MDYSLICSTWRFFLSPSLSSSFYGHSACDPSCAYAILGVYIFPCTHAGERVAGGLKENRLLSTPPLPQAASKTTSSQTRTSLLNTSLTTVYRYQNTSYLSSSRPSSNLSPLMPQNDSITAVELRAVSLPGGIRSSVSAEQRVFSSKDRMKVQYLALISPYSFLALLLLYILYLPR